MVEADEEESRNAPEGSWPATAAKAAKYCDGAAAQDTVAGTLLGRCCDIGEI